MAEHIYAFVCPDCRDLATKHRLTEESRHPDGTQRAEDVFVANYTRGETQTAFAEGRGTWRHILDEEVAEAYAETGDALSEELVQVAAVAVQWRAAQQRRNSINLGGLL